MRNHGVCSAFALCFVSLLAAAAGCGDDSPARSPGAGKDSGIQQPDGGDAAVLPDAAEDTGANDASDASESDAGGDGSTTTTIGPNGGTVESGGASVTIPAGALAEDTEIGVAEVAPPVPLPSGYVARSPVYAFTPHGLSFSSPVSIAIDYTETADTVLRLADASDTTWEPAAGATFASNVASLQTQSFSFYVVAQFQPATGTAAPLVPSAANFNDYVEDDGPERFRPTGKACDTNYTSGPYSTYRECIHAGEHRAVPIPGRTSCAGLTAVDTLAAFDWTCEVLNGTATMVSTGFKDDAGLSTLVDFSAGAWRENAVSVSDETRVILATPPAIWWGNPVVIDNDGMTS
jgi:hypothetical protein